MTYAPNTAAMAHLAVPQNQRYFQKQYPNHFGPQAVNPQQTPRVQNPVTVNTPTATPGQDTNTSDHNPLPTSNAVPNMTAASTSQVSSGLSINDKKLDVLSTNSDKSGSQTPQNQNKIHDDKSDFLQIPTTSNRVT